MTLQRAPGTKQPAVARQGQAARILQEADAYRQKVIDEATGKASRFDQIYAAYKKAPEVTRKRLYVEAVQSMLTNSSKIMVDVKGSNNLLSIVQKH